MQTVLAGLQKTKLAKVAVNTLPESHVLGGPDKLKNQQVARGGVTPIAKNPCQALSVSADSRLVWN